MKTKSWTQNLGKKSLNGKYWDEFLNELKRNDKGIRMGKKAKVLYKVSYKNIKDGSGTPVMDDFYVITDDKSSVLYPPVDNVNERSKQIINELMHGKSFADFVSRPQTDEDCEDGFVCVNNVCVPDTNMNNVATGVRTGVMNGTMISSSNINSVKAITTYNPSEFVPAITAHGYKIPKESWFEKIRKRLIIGFWNFFKDPLEDDFKEFISNMFTEGSADTGPR